MKTFVKIIVGVFSLSMILLTTKPLVSANNAIVNDISSWEDIERLSIEVEKIEKEYSNITKQDLDRFLFMFINNGGLKIKSRSYTFGPKLTQAEINLTKLSPSDAVKVLKSKERAEYWTKVWYQYASGHNDNADAFRHAIWNTFMVQKIGIREAKKWADAHEDFKGNPYLEKKMDLHNNQLGRSLNISSREDEVVSRVRKAIRNGKGLRIVSGKLVPTNE